MFPRGFGNVSAMSWYCSCVITIWLYYHMGVTLREHALVSRSCCIMVNSCKHHQSVCRSDRAGIMLSAPTPTGYRRVALETEEVAVGGVFLSGCQAAWGVCSEAPRVPRRLR